MTTPLLMLDSVGKSFGGVSVLSDLNLTMSAGSVHALVGQNGAGKSTLGKIIGGVYTPDRGRIQFDGADVTGWSTRKALRSGVATIQQELSLVPDRSVAENVFLGVEHHRAGFLVPDLRARFDELEARCRLGLDPRALVRDLRIADQQKVEIMRALSRDARVIVMDEPTSSLTADEVERLHAVIRQLRDDGRLVIYVTHFLDAVLEVCDRVTVLRDGQHIRTGLTSQETQDTLVEAMLGRSLDVAYPERPPQPSPTIAPIVQLVGATSAAGVAGVDLQIRPGEVVGLAGLVGSGRTEVARLIFGLDPLKSGRLSIAGEVVERNSPRRAMDRSIALIPEDRKRQGLIMTQDVQQNIGLLVAGRTASGRRIPFVHPRAERTLAQRLIEQLDIRPPRLRRSVQTMSGGNQQKVLFAKWIAIAPRIIVLDEPTRGVDIGARRQIYELIHDLAVQGAAVLIISSELEEVFGLAHRVVLLRRGKTVGEVDPRVASIDDVLYDLFGVRRSSKEKA